MDSYYFRRLSLQQDEKTLQTYGFSESSYHPSRPHAVVVRPMTTEEVSEIVKIADKYRVPVTAYGGGTSLEGHFSGVCLCSGYSTIGLITLALKRAFPLFPILIGIGGLNMY